MGVQDNKFDLKGLVELNNHDAMLMQETMGRYHFIVSYLRKWLAGWDFFALDSKGFLRYLISSLNRNIFLMKSLNLHSGLGTHFFIKELGMSLIILNVYGPYEGKKHF